jgi:segregation and condensation protein A
MEEALAPVNNLAIRLPIFEGPLDLLLYLIRRDEIDIYDIPIETVTRQYIDIIDSMETLDLEIAGEFFVMASTLMYIKSRMLLPKKDQAVDQDTENDAMDPRWELVQQLLEYRKFKEAAVQIEDLILNNNDRIARAGPKITIDDLERPIKPVDRRDLWNTFNQVLRRLSERITTGEIHAELVTVADRMEFILNHIKKKPRFLFTELFEKNTTLNTIVATFLAVLELTRLGELHVYQDHAFADICCETR